MSYSRLLLSWVRVPWNSLTYYLQGGQLSPPSVQWLLENRDEIKVAQTCGVSALVCLYRMYEYLVLGNNTGLRTEIEWFFNRADWAVEDIPDPKDPDPQRYAILAVLPHFMVEAYNNLIRRGLSRDSPAIIMDWAKIEANRAHPKLEKLPTWVFNVNGLDSTLRIPDGEGNLPKTEDASPEFLKMNILIAPPHTLFV